MKANPPPPLFFKAKGAASRFSSLFSKGEQGKKATRGSPL